MKNLLKEFKEFAMRGNVVDMAVGVIVGGAFGKIVTSLVNDIIMPGIGVLTGGTNFSEFKYVLKESTKNGDEIIPEVPSPGVLSCRRLSTSSSSPSAYSWPSR